MKLQDFKKKYAKSFKREGDIKLSAMWSEPSLISLEDEKELPDGLHAKAKLIGVSPYGYRTFQGGGIVN